MRQSISLFPHLRGELPPAYILHIEDDRADAFFARKIVYNIRNTHYEYYIDRVTNLAEARSALMNKHYSAILLDLGLHGLRRLESFDLLRSEARDVPIIILTGSDDSLEDQAIQRGAHAYIHKKTLTNDSTVIADALKSAVDARMMATQHH